MDLQYFPHFFRKNLPDIDVDNETLMEVGADFKKYLQDVFKDNPEKLEPIWNIDAKAVIMNEVNKTPFLVNGYHAALVLHFTMFMEKMKKEAIESTKN